MSLLSAVLAAGTTTPSPASTVNKGGSGSTTTLIIVAVIALVGTMFGVGVQFWVGRRTTEELKKSAAAAKSQAEAAKISAEAAAKSAGAAQDSVGVNRDTAAGVARRAEADALAKRYQDAADQLGHPYAPVRIAGVFALARLADDWPDMRQECVDVLCGYLRMPWPTDAISESEVRQTVVQVIQARLVGEASWSPLRFNFRRAEFRNLSLTNCYLPDCTFMGATFKGKTRFTNVRFEGATDFTETVITEGSLDFYGSFEVGDLHFDRSRIAASGTVTFEGLVQDPPSAQAVIYLAKANIEGALAIRFFSTSPAIVNAEGLTLTGEVTLGDLGRTSPYAGPADRFPSIFMKDWTVSGNGRVKVLKALSDKRVTVVPPLKRETSWYRRI